MLAPAVAALVQRLDPSPTYVTGRRFDILAANRAARLLWTDWSRWPAPERNLVWWTFTDPEARATFTDWPAEAAAALARYRAVAGRHRGDPAFDELTTRLHEASAEVRAWWPRHEIAPLGSCTKRLRHPMLGELKLHNLVLQVADDPEQRIVTFAAGEHDHARIAALLEAERSAAPADDARGAGRASGP